MADTKSPKAVSSPKAASSKDTSPRSPKSPARSPEGATIHEEEHASIDAEVNFGDGDGDSAVGDSVSIYTTSLASSVLDYPVEHGRRYHAYQHGRYTRPNDEQEMDRLLIMHSVVTEAIGGLYRAPIDETKPLRILDIGTGSGIWAVEVGEQLPNATIIGTDLSANMPTFVPPNVVFEVDDVENEWVFEAPFDYIFSRYMVASIADWPKLVARTFANLIPGGWAEFQDFDLTYHSDDGSLQPDDPLLTWIETGTQAAAAMGRDPLPGRKLAGWFGDAGFSNIVHRRYKLPLGPWPRDPVLKRIGLHNYMQLNQGLEGMSLRLYTQVLGWTEQQVLVMLTQVRQSLHNPNIHPILDFPANVDLSADSMPLIDQMDDSRQDTSLLTVAGPASYGSLHVPLTPYAAGSPMSTVSGHQADIESIGFASPSSFGGSTCRDGLETPGREELPGRFTAFRATSSPESQHGRPRRLVRSSVHIPQADVEWPSAAGLHMTRRVLQFLILSVFAVTMLLYLWIVLADG